MTIPKQLLEAKIMKAEASYDFLKDEVHCLYEEKKELKARIDKAIEYIDRRDIDWGSEEHDKLLDILKGSYKE